MAQIGSRIRAAGVAGASRIDRLLITRIPGMFDVDPSGRRKEAPVPRVACWDDAVKHIDASFYALKDILGKANPHEVTRFFFGKVLENYICHLPHEALGLTHAEATHGITIKPDLHEIHR